jgi:hypothetical protein
LPSLQEVDYYKPPQTVTGEQIARRNSPTFSNRSRTQSPHFARDAALNTVERQTPRRSTEESLRSQSAAGGSIIEKSGVKRMGSTSSKQSGSMSRLPSARDSDPQVSRNLVGRMSEEDRERQFEELVQGKETVKYTLTPENMRALDVSHVLPNARIGTDNDRNRLLFERQSLTVPLILQSRSILASMLIKITLSVQALHPLKPHPGARVRGLSVTSLHQVEKSLPGHLLESRALNQSPCGTLLTSFVRLVHRQVRRSPYNRLSTSAEMGRSRRVDLLVPSVASRPSNNPAPSL